MSRLVPSIAVLSVMMALSIFAPPNAQAQNFHFQCPGCTTVGGGSTVFDDVFYVFTVETTASYDFFATATSGGSYEYFFSTSPDPVFFASVTLTNASNPNTFVGSVNLIAGTEYFVRAEMLEDCTQQNLNCQTTLKMQVAGTPPPTDVVPEPISMVLLGTGLAGVGAMRRRRKANRE